MAPGLKNQHPGQASVPLKTLSCFTLHGLVGRIHSIYSKLASFPMVGVALSITMSVLDLTSLAQVSRTIQAIRFPKYELLFDCYELSDYKIIFSTVGFKNKLKGSIYESSQHDLSGNQIKDFFLSFNILFLILR